MCLCRLYVLCWCVVCRAVWVGSSMEFRVPSQILLVYRIQFDCVGSNYFLIVIAAHSVRR